MHIFCATMYNSGEYPQSIVTDQQTFVDSNIYVDFSGGGQFVDDNFYYD